MCCVDLKYSQDEDGEGGWDGQGTDKQHLYGQRGWCTAAKDSQCNSNDWVLFCADEEDILNALG